MMCSRYQSIDNNLLITDPASLKSFTVSNKGTTRSLSQNVCKPYENCCKNKTALLVCQNHTKMFEPTKQHVLQNYVENILHIPFSLVMQTDSYAILLCVFCYVHITKNDNMNGNDIISVKFPLMIPYKN